MAGRFTKFSVTDSLIFCFLAFFQSAMDGARSQTEFSKQIVPSHEKFQMSYKDQFINEAQTPQIKNFQVQYESQVQYIENIPNERPLPYNSLVQFDSHAPYANQKRNTVQILNDNQLNISQLPNNELPNNNQLINNFILPFTNNFPGPRTNFILFLLTESNKLLQEAFQKDQSNFRLNISAECSKSLTDLQTGLTEGKSWAIRMIDSSGKIPNGILDGTLMNFGDYDMCLDIKLPGKYQGMYCMIDFKRSGNSGKGLPLQPLNLSSTLNRDFTKSIFEESILYGEASVYQDVPITTTICLPSVCSETEVQNILTEVTSYFQFIDSSVRHCEIRKEIHLNYGQRIVLYVILGIILFEVFATILDLRLRYFHKEQFSEIELSKTVQYTLAFSFYSNTIRIFKKNETADSIKIFQGMKVISMSWTIINHTAGMYAFGLGRLYQALLACSGFFFQIVLNGFMATETFFFISGFLVMYSVTKEKTTQIKFVPFVLIRFIRLMPPVLLLLGCSLLFESLSSGPLWIDVITNNLQVCKRIWWTNVLFINNLFGFLESCLPWTWYIAADMQLYLISYPILILMKRNPERAVLVLKIIITASVVGLVICQVTYNLPPTASVIYYKFWDYMYFLDVMHFRTHNHVTSYFVGMFTGYIIATKKNINLTGGRQFLGWCIAVLFGVVCVFTSYIWNHRGRLATTMESALYGGINKFLWSSMLSYVTYLSLNGKAGIVVSLLSWDGFVPLARLTFMAYLIHPIVQMFYLGQLRYVILTNIPSWIFSCFTFLTVSYVLALPACLICESPFTRILSILFSSKFNKTKNKVKERLSV